MDSIHAPFIEDVPGWLSWFPTYSNATLNSSSRTAQFQQRTSSALTRSFNDRQLTTPPSFWWSGRLWNKDLAKSFYEVPSPGATYWITLVRKPSYRALKGVPALQLRCLIIEGWSGMMCSWIGGCSSELLPVKGPHLPPRRNCLCVHSSMYRWCFSSPTWSRGHVYASRTWALIFSPCARCLNIANKIFSRSWNYYQASRAQRHEQMRYAILRSVPIDRNSDSARPWRRLTSRSLCIRHKRSLSARCFIVLNEPLR